MLINVLKGKRPDNLRKLGRWRSLTMGNDSLTGKDLKNQCPVEKQLLNHTKLLKELLKDLDSLSFCLNRADSNPDNIESELRNLSSQLSDIKNSVYDIQDHVTSLDEYASYWEEECLRLAEAEDIRDLHAFKVYKYFEEKFKKPKT